jgi:hypothetical protein
MAKGKTSNRSCRVIADAGERQELFEAVGEFAIVALHDGLR